MRIRCCIFDLDGVIVDTAKFHFLAWRRLANELGFDFTATQNEQLKGVSRRASLEMILDWGKMEMSEDDIAIWMDRKNAWYLEMIETMAEGDALTGVIEFIQHLKDLGLYIALGSASRNARFILQKLNIIGLFDSIVDGNSVSRGKPHPETFLKAIEGTTIKPEEGIVFEDSTKGIASATSGGFYTVGIGDANDLPDAQVIIPNFETIDFSRLVAQLKQLQINSDVIL